MIFIIYKFWLCFNLWISCVCDWNTEYTAYTLLEIKPIG